MAPTKINVKDRLSEDGEIDLSMSDLQEVPVQQIVVLKKAFSLDLSNNHLVKLPKNFSTLLHISKLDLSKNAIKELPENFGELTKLTYLDLYQNKLEHLPLSFGKLKALKWLDLKDNPLVPAVSKVAGQCLDAKECQVCAKKVVAFFANLQNTVDQENAQREQSRKKQLEFNQQKNKEEKQAKKKDSKKIKEKQHLEKAVKNENNIQKKKDIKTKSNNKSAKVESPKKATKTRSWFSVFVSLLFAIIISLFIATSISFAPLESFKNSTSLVYYQYLNKLPPNLQPYGIVLGDKIKNLHVKTGALTEHVIEFLKTNEQIHIICQSATEVVQNVTSKIVQVYTDTFPKRT